VLQCYCNTDCLYLKEGEVSQLQFNEIKELRTPIKCEAFSLEVWKFPEGSRGLRLPDFRTDNKWRCQCFQQYASATFTHQEIFLVLISFRPLVDLSVIVLPGELCRLNFHLHHPEWNTWLSRCNFNSYNSYNFSASKLSVFKYFNCWCILF